VNLRRFGLGSIFVGSDAGELGHPVWVSFSPSVILRDRCLTSRWHRGLPLEPGSNRTLPVVDQDLVVRGPVGARKCRYLQGLGLRSTSDVLRLELGTLYARRNRHGGRTFGAVLILASRSAASRSTSSDPITCGQLGGEEQRGHWGSPLSRVSTTRSGWQVTIAHTASTRSQRRRPQCRSSEAKSQGGSNRTARHATAAGCGAARNDRYSRG